MKISESWLREWVNPPLTTQALASQLTMAGLEVDAIDPVAGAFNKVVVARVVATRAHPQADRLTICEVDAGDGAVLQVVCGAMNVRPHLRVALAKIGAQLPGDFVIKETKLRGELSQGMLCSADELGLTDRSEGILELAEDAPLGMDFREYLGLDDQILDLDLTPNRADCLSILGVARDLAALNQLPLKAWTAAPLPVTIDTTIPVQVSAKQACPLYTGRMISGINPNATTPVAIKERLRRSDIRSMHPVVDVLNYVMLELGQPMHAFDAQQIKGQLHVRQATATESLVALSGQECALDQKVLVIADDENVLALAGIMGAEASSVQSHTTDIWLESACFDPLAITGVARRFALSSEAAHRFERGVDPHLAVLALERATALLHAIVGGQIGPIVEQQSQYFPTAPIMISFRPNQVLRLSGMQVSDEEIADILMRLGMLLVRHADVWEVTVPSYRFDLRLEVDLVEEVIRVFGYDNIPNQATVSSMRAGSINATEQLSTRIMTFLSHRGYRETISYSFVDPQLQRALYPDSLAKTVVNPISSELSEMRLGLWPGLLASMLHNVYRQQSALKLCETGKVFLFENEVLEEHVACAGLMLGEYGQCNWNEQATTYDFYDMKGDVQALFSDLKQHDISFVTGSHPALHPGKTARLMRGEQPVGWLGALHPRLLDSLDLNMDVIVFEVMVAALQDNPSVRYQKISKYPQIRRDLSLLVDETISAQAIEDVVREVIDPAYLKSFYVFDVYTDDAMAMDHKKSMAIGLMLQSDVATLNEVDISTMMNHVIEALEHRLSAILRTVEERKD